MLSELTKPEVTAFIEAHETASQEELDRLLLNKEKYTDLPMVKVVEQIKARQKAKTKLPFWHATPGIIMPSALAIEQSSSEITAAHKFERIEGGTALDLTGGAGIDSYYLAKKFREVVYIEQSEELAEIAAHNFACLGVTNIEVVNAKCEDYLKELKGHVDFIYADPARRVEDVKVVQIRHYSPNLMRLQNLIFEHTESALVKASPMLDINMGVKQLNHVIQVQVVAVNNEVKELLFYQNSVDCYPGKRLDAADLSQKTLFFTTLLARPKAPLSEALTYVYEPNAAILKTGKQNELSKMFNLFKLHDNTHLYTSDKLEPKFPGRIFRLKANVKYNTKEIISVIGRPKANIAVRNFPDTVAQFRQKTKIKPGGNEYLFGILDWQENVKVLCCSKI